MTTLSKTLAPLIDESVEILYNLLPTQDVNQSELGPSQVVNRPSFSIIFWGFSAQR